MLFQNVQLKLILSVTRKTNANKKSKKKKNGQFDWLQFDKVKMFGKFLENAYV